ncbi:MAG: hypothetical protein ABI321_01370 [Polyangia bacterium]
MRKHILVMLLTSALSGCGGADQIYAAAERVIPLASGGVAAVTVVSHYVLTSSFDGEQADLRDTRLFVHRLDASGHDAGSTKLTGTHVDGIVELASAALLVASGTDSTSTLTIVEADGHTKTTPNKTCGTGLQRVGDTTWLGASGGTLCKVSVAADDEVALTPGYTWTPDPNTKQGLVLSSGGTAALVATQVQAGQGYTDITTLQRWDATGKELQSVELDGHEAIAIRERSDGAVVIFSNVFGVGLARTAVKPDGSLETEVDSEGSASSSAVTLDPDGKSLIGRWNGPSSEGTSLLGVDGRVLWTAPIVDGEFDVARLVDGSYVVSGYAFGTKGQWRSVVAAVSAAGVPSWKTELVD